MRPERMWPLAIVGVLVVTVGLELYLYRVATGQGASTVEPDYYGRAVRWDSTMALERGSRALGWEVSAEVGALDREGKATVRVRLLGHAGRPLSGLRVHVEAIHNLDADHPREADLVAGPPGVYAATLPLARPGMWELRLDARRGREHFVASVRRDVTRGEP